MTAISSSLSDSTHPGPLAAPSYAPTGQVAWIEEGVLNGAFQWENQEQYDYNNRLQPVRIQNGGCGAYNYYVGLSSPTSCTMPSAPPSGTGNNGNVMAIIIRTP
jgi:hypothetical protein